MKKVRDGNYSLEGRKKILRFDGDLKDAIIILAPAASHCLWVLDSLDLRNPYVVSALRPLVHFSNVERILPSEPTPYYERIWGMPPPQDWCYFYQRAGFARQQKDWSTVIRLYEQAQEKGFAPRHPVEYAPFIEAYAARAQWGQAERLTETARKPIEQADLPLEDYLCAVWERVQRDSGDQPEVTRVLLAMDCE